jgi:hypothetical protein
MGSHSHAWAKPLAASEVRLLLERSVSTIVVFGTNPSVFGIAFPQRQPG